MQKRIKAVLKSHGLASPAKELYRTASKLYRTIIGSDRLLVKRYLGQRETRKLHIGCGGNVLKNWLNTDYFPETRDVIHLDATQRYPFSDNTFDYIFSEHMIEHVPYVSGQRMLRECWRVLKVGGRIRISTPDLSFLIALYGSDKSALQSEYIKWAAGMCGDRTPAEDAFVINEFVRAWGHAFIYDEKTLRKSLERAGFREIGRLRLNESRDEALRNLENEERL